MPRGFFLTLLALTVAFSGCSKSGANGGPKDAVILIIRHAEKTEAGPGLSPRGMQRAAAYAQYFANFTFDGKPIQLGAIFAAADSHESERSSLTAEPVAKALKLPLNTRYKNERYEELAEHIRTTMAGKKVLIAWHQGEIPSLIKALGADPELLLPKGKWPNETFDWLIQLAFDANGHPIPLHTKRIFEELLPGDAR